MATFRKRNGLWQAQVRSRNVGSISKSFHKKSDAQEWARAQEILMQKGEWGQRSPKTLRIQDMMEKYLKEVTPSKRGAKTEERRIKRLLKEKDLMAKPLSNASPCLFASYRDKRIAEGIRACQYDLVLLRHAWNIARIEWGWSLGDNPLSLIRMPKSNPPRERRLRSGEYEKLKVANRKSKAWYLMIIIDIAIDTGMRRGEIINLTWNDIDFIRARALLNLTKNGRSRWVPLSQKVLTYLKQIDQKDDYIFPITDTAVRQAWERLRQRAGILDLTFHDLRHEAISRMFESGLNVPQVMAISGHRTASQLFRYVQIH